MSTYETIDLEKDGPVATITIYPQEETMTEPGIDLHWDFGRVFGELRGDNDVRVIVLTGSGEEFFLPPPADFFQDQDQVADYVLSPSGSWRTFIQGIVRFHQEMAEIEKPIVTRMNGDASTLGMSFVFASDLIVAVEGAQVVDNHLGMGQNPPGPDFGLVPGDGGAALIPLFLPPTLAKEFLMLARPFSAEEMADLGVINHVVPENRLDEKVDEIVEGLLQRPAYALAWTKRVANRRIVEQLNRTLDAGAAYEMVNFLQLQLQGGEQSRDL